MRMVEIGPYRFPLRSPFRLLAAAAWFGVCTGVPLGEPVLGLQVFVFTLITGCHGYSVARADAIEIEIQDEDSAP